MTEQARPLGEAVIPHLLLESSSAGRETNQIAIIVPPSFIRLVRRCGSLPEILGATAKIGFEPGSLRPPNTKFLSGGAGPGPGRLVGDRGPRPHRYPRNGSDHAGPPGPVHGPEPRSSRWTKARRDNRPGFNICNQISNFPVPSSCPWLPPPGAECLVISEMPPLA